MGTGSSVVRPEEEEGESRRPKVTVDRSNNNIAKGTLGNNITSLQVQALLSSDYKEEKHSVPRRAVSFQVRGSEPIAGSKRRIKYRAPLPPTTIAPFRISNSVRNVAVASVGEVKVTGSLLGKRNDVLSFLNVPKITIEDRDSVVAETSGALTMTDTCMGETILERNGSALMPSLTSPNPKPIPSPRLSKAQSMNRQGSPVNDRTVRRRNTDVNTNSNSRHGLARSLPLPKMRQTLSPPVSNGDGHVKQLSDGCIDEKASMKPTVHPRQHSDPLRSTQVVGNDANDSGYSDTQKARSRTNQNVEQCEVNTPNDLAHRVDSNTHGSVSMDTNTQTQTQRVKPSIRPRATRPNSFKAALRLDTDLAKKPHSKHFLTGDETPEEANERISELVTQCQAKAKRTKKRTKHNSEENSEGYHSSVSSQVEDVVDDHDDDGDIVLSSESSPLNKSKNTHVAPTQSALSPTSPIRPRHPSYLRAVYTRSSTLSSNDSLDSVDEHPFGLSYGSTGTQAADDERSDTLGDSVRSLDLLSSTDSLSQKELQSSPVQLRKKAQRSDAVEVQQSHRPLRKSISDSQQRLAASCEALHDQLLRSSLPEEEIRSLRITKSKSTLDVPEKVPSSNNSPSSSPRSGAGSPRLESRFNKVGLDHKNFFSKFSRMQSSSPTTRRKTAPILEANEKLSVKSNHKSTPVELFSNSPLHPNRLRPPDYETTLHNLVEGTTKVDRERENRLKRYSLQPSDYRSEAWLTGPEVRVKRPSISTAFDSDLSPDDNLASLNLEGLNQTYPSGKRGKKSGRSVDDWGTLVSPRYSRKSSKGLTLSLIRRKENKPEKDTLSLFPPEGFTLTLPDVCFVIDLDTPIDETCVDADFEVQRIPEYDKYLQELRGETTPSHPDYEELTKTAQRVSNMVKEREEEMNNAENEYKVENVQDRFPNDDLHLNEKEKSNQRIRALQTRRRSAPSAVLIKSIGAKTRGAPNINSRPMPFVSDELPSHPHNSKRTYLLEGPVQLSAGMQPQDRYLFLFNDILLIAKKKSATTFKLKNRIRVCELWLTKHFLEDVTEASSSTCPPERSFVIGWPTTNMVATFNTADLKDLWLTKLTNQIAEEKSREVPKTVMLRILNKEMPGYASSKNITVMNTEEVNDVIKTCMEQFEISDAKAEDYQIWVRSGREGTMSASAYPLFGHEHPFSIKMSHVRDAAKSTGNIVVAEDTELGSECVPPEHQCQFVIKHKSKTQMLNFVNKKNKKSPIASLFKRSVSRRDMVDIDSVDSSIQGKLFGQRLADICEDDVFPKPVLDMLIRLFHEGPLATGILRKSANKRLCDNLKNLFDDEKDYNIDDWSILVIGDTLKLFFREMPDSIFGGDVYERFVGTCDIEDQEDRLDEVKRLIESLPKCNQNLLRYLFSVLHRIDENNKENNMDSYNLAVCVGPSILRNPTPGVDYKDLAFQEQVKKETLCIQFVIENFLNLFGEESLKLFGEPKTTLRQDSGTDSDSMHSILSMQESSGGLRRDDSSLDSLDRELYNTEMDSSPQLAKSHLSPTNLSRDSGLTLSDTQLYEESGESENSNNSGGRPGHPEIVFSREDLLMPVPPPRSKRRRGSEPQTNLDTARVLARMCAVPGNGALASGMGQEKTRGSLCHSMSGDVFRTMKHGGQLQTKKLSMESLRSVEENSESEFNPDFERFQTSGDIGVLRKSSSGAKLFFDEDMIMTHHPGEPVPSSASTLTVSCDKRRSSTEYSSQESEPSTPSSPNLYRRIWLSEAANSTKPGSLSASYGGSPHQYQNSLNPNYVPQSGMISGNKLSAPLQSHARSAPSTPNESSPSSSPRGSFSKYLSKDSTGSSPQASSTDLLSNDSDGDSPPPRPPKPPTLSLVDAPTQKSGKYSDTVGCGSPPPEVILRNQLYKGQQGPEQIFDFDSPKLLGVDRTKLAHDMASSCSSDDDDRPTRSVTSSLSSLNSGGSQEQTDKVGTGKVARASSLQKPTFVEKSSSDTNVLKQFSKRRDYVQKRPDRPPSYQEAIHRKILLKSGNGTTQAVTYTDKDVVEQSANSANARKLYEESLKKYNQTMEVSSGSSPSKAGGAESRPGFPKHSISSAIPEESLTPPKSPSAVKRSQSDSDKMKDLKHYKNNMFYSPSRKNETQTGKQGDSKKPENSRKSSGNRNPSTRYSDCTPLKVDKNAATVQYYKSLVKTAPEPNVLKRNPPPYRHPPPIQTSTASWVKTKETSGKADEEKPRLRRQGSGPKPIVDLDTLVCTEESLV